MNDKVNGLILRISDYKENDLLLDVITSDKSFLSLVAKGTKKLSGKKHYYGLCLYEFIIDYKDNKTIYTIHNSKLIKSYYDDNNLKTNSFKNILTELTLKSKELYELDMYKNIIFTLDNLKENNLYLLGSFYLSYLLKIYGINPNVDNCVVCGNSKVISISNRLGGFVCKDHLNGLEPLDIDTLKKFRLINKAKYENYDSIKDIEFTSRDFDIIMDFYLNNSDNNIKAYKLYKELFV